MDLYFSGLKNAADIDIVKNAGVEKVLVDQFDFVKNREKLIQYGFKIALDSGAYRAFKDNVKLDPASYLELIYSFCFRFEFVVMLDVIGNPEQTHKAWKEYFRSHADEMNIIPVWHYGSDHRYLASYLNQSQVVGIGGLVNLMREKNETVLKDLKKLLKDHPNRFHLFGINWLKAINQLHPLLKSGDTSKFLDGARYGTVIHAQSSKKGKQFLNDCKASLYEIYENCFDLSARTKEGRRARCLLSARNMDLFVNKPEQMSKLAA